MTVLTEHPPRRMHRHRASEKPTPSADPEWGTDRDRALTYLYGLHLEPGVEESTTAAQLHATYPDTTRRRWTAVLDRMCRPSVADALLYRVPGRSPATYALGPKGWARATRLDPGSPR